MDDLSSVKGRYWKAQVRCVLVLLLIWFVVSFGMGILFRDFFDKVMPKVGNAPFGFWMAQQGSIMSFVALLVVYALWMGRLERKFEKAGKEEA